MNRATSSHQQGWVSLPIIALLLAVSALSMRYQETLFASYKWRSQLSDVANEQAIWENFRQTFVVSPSFDVAVLSDCEGFCALNRLQNTAQEKSWTNDGNTLDYQWTMYVKEETQDDGVTVISTTTSYRLCATQNQQAYLCWWWRDGKRLAEGWAFAS